MNYYEHHIGDYAEATAHLTFVEDAAYSRMIRKYYAQEKPLPADVRAVQRLIGARTKEEREAVESVLAEFFQLDEDGWHNPRCDAELARFDEKTGERQAKREAEKERQRLHRERRKELFAALREHGIVPAFDTSTTELVTMLSQVQSQHVTQPVTRDATATQSPVTSHQSPDLKEKAAGDSTAETAPFPSGSRVGEICIILRRKGINTGPDAIRDLAWVTNSKVTDEIIVEAVELAKKRQAKFSPNYLSPIIADLLAAAEAGSVPPVKDWV